MLKNMGIFVINNSISRIANAKQNMAVIIIFDIYSDGSTKSKLLNKMLKFDLSPNSIINYRVSLFQSLLIETLLIRTEKRVTGKHKICVNITGDWVHTLSHFIRINIEISVKFKTKTILNLEFFFIAYYINTDNGTIVVQNTGTKPY